MVNMSVAAVIKANDVEWPIILTYRTASKNQSGDCAATLPTCFAVRQLPDPRMSAIAIGGPFVSWDL
jgi:hypothetical protein